MMKKILTVFFLACCSCVVMAQDNVIDEVVWVVGDDAILRSDIEAQRLYLQQEGQRLEGDPYCVIPENMAIQKLYLNQAKIDSIEVSESQIIQQVDQWMNFAINQIGSREKLEEYFNKKFSQIKEERKEMVREQQIVDQMKHQLIGEIKLTPSEVRKYYNQLSKDSLPFIPTTVEVQIITFEPKIPFEETDAIKARLRDFTEQITSGKMEFSTLARLYSEDPESAKRGGELGFMGKTQLLPEFANVAFNLNDPKRVSPIVQTEYGYHIIQLIEKRGDRLNCRHILLRPKVADKELNDAMIRMDSLYNDLKADKFTFDEAATWLSYDKDTRNNKGLMVNQNYEGNHVGTPKFEMQELPQEVGKVVYSMNVGEISKPFKMITDKQKEVVAIVKLKSRTEGHKANLSDDYQALKALVEGRKRAELLDDWIRKKQKTTYVRIAEGWRNCDFKYPGWIKE
ncbi:peptidylprolyl isomerase [Parabacteroides bouchesdurhonensis]|uniref:peptidylprolyl isomerase n=1 Tax=Parabacteroides bouchesdurhonensis TaxID=1936995 RepID=UPI000C8230DF|nr:peptidylprolyl isomerase [Parabacteroides bouchesdurhonensis]RHJ90356.1 peptidylprolyl isomerase [Bacteroides sp. AM07-16]